MGAEKHGSKGGGGRYVGGFLQLFDWNGKSRKKLFSNKSDNVQGGQKQGKRSKYNLTEALLNGEDDYGGSSMKGSSDYSCVSSVTDEEGNETKAPGVVARLMGLDSLPTSSVSDVHSTSTFDSRFLRDSRYQRSPDFEVLHQYIYSGRQPTRLEGFSHNPAESRPQRLISRPIERFQTEVLPPKSAKSIPMTHHKLLSPIKTPGFVTTKNAAQIMDEASRIIEPGPRLNSKGKMPPVGSSSGPLKLRNLKEKMESVHRPSKFSESSQRPVESKAVKHLKGQPLNKSWNGVEDGPQLRPSSSHSEDGSSGLKSKGKSISLAVQAKVNVQRREVLGSSSSHSFQGQREHDEFKSSQQNRQKNVQKKPSVPNASRVLRQNNLKQNSTNKGKTSSKVSVSTNHGKRTLSDDGSFGRNKATLGKVTGNSKVRPRNTDFDTKDCEQIVTLSRTGSRPQKRRSIEGDLYFEKSGIVETLVVDKDEKPVQNNDAINTHLKLVVESRRNGMDIVSFTFNSPMKKPMPGSQAVKPLLETHNNSSSGFSHEKVSTDMKNTKLLSLGLNDIGGDALSILLEQKLRELTYGIASFHNSTKSGSITSSPSIQPDVVNDLTAGSTIAEGCGNRFRHGLNIDKLSSGCESNCSATEDRINAEGCDNRFRHGINIDELSSGCESNCSATEDHMLQGTEEVGDPSVSGNDEGRNKFNCRHPSPISILEPPFSNESSISSGNSSDSGGDSMNGKSGQCSFSQSQEVVDSNSPKKHLPVQSDVELCDSASSTFLSNTSGEQTHFNLSNLTRTDNWELEYVREVLFNAEFMFNDFTLGQTDEIITPHPFDKLENQNTSTSSYLEESDATKLKRKVLFDCIIECLHLRFRPNVGGGCQGRAKGEAILQRKVWLTNEIYKEISNWRSMGDWMLDGIVDKDMSSQYGRWLDFEIQEFELGVEIGKDILSSLMDELLTDIFLGQIV